MWNLVFYTGSNSTQHLMNTVTELQNKLVCKQAGYDSVLCAASYLWSCEAVTYPAPQQEGRRCADAALSRQRLHFPVPAELGLTLLSEEDGMIGRKENWRQEEGKGRDGKWELNIKVSMCQIRAILKAAKRGNITICIHREVAVSPPNKTQ